MRRVFLLLLVALAGCGSKTVTVKVEGLGPRRTSTVNRAALAQCRAENETIRIINRVTEERNREQESLPLAERHIKLIKPVKLCLP